MNAAVQGSLGRSGGFAIHDVWATTAPTAGSAPEREADDLVAVTIPELISAEERLAHQAHLGDLQPTDARRLAAVTAELDRRWSAGSLTRPHGDKKLGAHRGERFSPRADRSIRFEDAERAADEIEQGRGPSGSLIPEGVQ